MTEQKGQSDPNEPPEDVASLYSWANLHGAKYRDFSASRAQTREKARQRVEQAMEQEHLRTQQPLEPKRGNGDTRHEESAPQSAATPSGSYASRPGQPLPPDRQSIDRPNIDRPQTEHPIREDLATALRGLAVPPSYRQPGQTPHAPMREESFTPSRSAWSTDPAENAGRPAWLMPDRTEVATPSSLPPAPEDTLQGSRERLATRWFALRSVVEGSAPPAQAAPAPVAARAPVMAIFSLAVAWEKPASSPRWDAHSRLVANAFCSSTQQPTACSHFSLVPETSAPECCAPSVLRSQAAMRPFK